MKSYLVTFTKEPFFMKCGSEEEALNVATEYSEIVNCLVISDTPISVRNLEMRMSFAPDVQQEDLREYMGELTYKEVTQNSEDKAIQDAIELLEDKESQNGKENK